MDMSATAQLLQDLRLPSSYHVRNRQNLKECLAGSFLVLLAAGRPPRRTADENYPFFANRNFFYTTGIEQENAILLLYQNEGMQRDILFLPQRDPLQERWTGNRLGLEEGAARSGLTEIEFLPAFEGILTDLLAQQPSQLWLDESAEDPQAAEIRSFLTSSCPDREKSDLAPFLARLRMIKSAEEIALMRQAIALTDRGIQAILDKLRPGRMEYELWGAFQNALAMEGCLTPAFASITASGDNIFCLHYMNPRSKVSDGDLVQIDVGAIVGGLCADISRVYPANGRFSPRQLAIYQLVRKCQEMAFATIRPGIRMSEVNDRCKDIAKEGLTELGILSENGQVTDYYWHNVSHQLGLDVHDTADREALIQPGMVLTVEPGIYVPEWQVGLRIEDDVLVTGQGCENLSQAIPREAAEIEFALQNRPSQL
jgi:Xaa-Pro aminopeptidase